MWIDKGAIRDYMPLNRVSLELARFINEVGRNEVERNEEEDKMEIVETVVKEAKKGELEVNEIADDGDAYGEAPSEPRAKKLRKEPKYAHSIFIGASSSRDKGVCSHSSIPLSSTEGVPSKWLLFVSTLQALYLFNAASNFEKVAYLENLIPEEQTGRFVHMDRLSLTYFIPELSSIIVASQGRSFMTIDCIDSADVT